jgi:TRAP-type C4-dicarboxylate transport system permease small subunit
MTRTVLWLARAMALTGGAILTFLIVMTCVSVIGRGLNQFLHTPFMEQNAPGLAQALLDLGVGPILGDYELVEAGIAFAIFAFLPLCQMTGGHAAVDIFTSKMPAWTNRLILMVVEVVFAAVLVLIAWRLYAGMETKMRYGETTFLLRFPIWWAYGASFVGACLAALSSIYMAGVRIAEFFTGRVIMAQEGEADH